MADQDIALMAHLMRRASFGATREELEARVAKGYDATVEELLHPEEHDPLDRNEMMRYHPWTWRPGYHKAVGTDELAERIAVAARPTTEIQHSRATQLLRTDQAATVIFGKHVFVDIGERGAQLGRHIVDRAAGIGFQILRPLQRLSVIFPHLVQHR